MHLISIDDLSTADIEDLFQLSDGFLEVAYRPIKKVPTLRGRTQINMFFEASTRTLTSFELAGKRLSADVVNIKGSGSACQQGGEPQGHHPHPRELQAGHPGDTALLGGGLAAGHPLHERVGHQRRGRHGRAPHPVPARPLQPAARVRRAGGAEGGHRRRHRAQPRGALGPVRLPQDGDRRAPGRAAHADAARHRGVGRSCLRRPRRPGGR